MQKWTLEESTNFVGETFRLWLDEDHSLPVELVEVSPVEIRPQVEGQELPASLRRGPCSLLFRAPPGACPGQGLYRIEHPRLEASSLFLVPVRTVDGEERLEAILA